MKHQVGRIDVRMFNRSCCLQLMCMHPLQVATPSQSYFFTMEDDQDCVSEAAFAATLPFLTSVLESSSIEKVVHGGHDLSQYLRYSHGIDLTLGPIFDTQVSHCRLSCHCCCIDTSIIWHAERCTSAHEYVPLPGGMASLDYASCGVVECIFRHVHVTQSPRKLLGMQNDADDVLYLRCMLHTQQHPATHMQLHPRLA